MRHRVPLSFCSGVTPAAPYFKHGHHSKCHKLFYCTQPRLFFIYLYSPKHTVRYRATASVPRCRRRGIKIRIQKKKKKYCTTVVHWRPGRLAVVRIVCATTTSVGSQSALRPHWSVQLNNVHQAMLFYTPAFAEAARLPDSSCVL